MKVALIGVGQHRVEVAQAGEREALARLAADREQVGVAQAGAGLPKWKAGRANGQ